MTATKQPSGWECTQCQGKHRFDNPQLARTAAERSRKAHECKTSAYRCRYCGGWHVGSSVLTTSQRRHTNSKYGKRRKP